MKSSTEWARQAWSGLRLACPGLSHCDSVAGVRAVAKVLRASMLECAGLARTHGLDGLLSQDAGVIGEAVRRNREEVAKAIEEAAGK